MAEVIISEKEHPTFAVVGPPDTLADILIREKYGENAQITYTKTLEELFELAENGEVDNAIFPTENSVYGSFNEPLRLSENHNVFITEELHLKEDFCLLGIGNVDELKKVGSSKVGLYCCRKYLSTYFPDLEQIQTKNTGEAAEIASQDKTFGAIADRRVTGIYENLKVLRKEVNDWG